MGHSAKVCVVLDQFQCLLVKFVLVMMSYLRIIKLVAVISWSGFNGFL